jgi:hypothetical protein
VVGIVSEPCKDLDHAAGGELPIYRDRYPHRRRPGAEQASAAHGGGRQVDAVIVLAIPLRMR